MSYRPPFSADRIAALREWHERVYREMSDAGERRVSYLGLDLVVPAGVFAPTPDVGPARQGRHRRGEAG